MIEITMMITASLVQTCRARAHEEGKRRVKSEGIILQLLEMRTLVPNLYSS
jgi:hypothetical protein